MIHGVDTRSKAWHVLREDGGYDSHVVGRSVSTDEARIELGTTWHGYVDSYVAPGDTIVCEEPLGLSNPKTSRILAMAAGSVHLATFWPRPCPLGCDDPEYAVGGPNPDGQLVCSKCLYSFDQIRFVWADVAQWKRLIVGAGNADKDAIAAYVLLTYGDVYGDQDHADAVCIRDFGKLLEGMGWERPLSDKDLKKLRKKDAAAADAHVELVATGMQHLTSWRATCV